MGKKYSVVDIFPTIQGEGFHAGRAAVFCRFAGCNVWNGLEKDRQKSIAKGKCASICDTKFTMKDAVKGAGGIYSEQELADKIHQVWTQNMRDVPADYQKFVVFTGGEPSLQLTKELVQKLNDKKFYVAVETNGSNPIPKNVNWITLSPKPPMVVVDNPYSEVKVLYPFFNPAKWINRAKLRYIQPVDFSTSDLSPDEILAKNKRASDKCVDFVLKNPSWRISVQTHKVLGLK